MHERRSTRRDITSPVRNASGRVVKHSQHAPTRTGYTKPQESLEDEQTRKWVSEEDSFVLRQAKKKADIRVREGRPKPIDRLAVILKAIDSDRDLLDVDDADTSYDFASPANVFEGLSRTELSELQSDIVSYLTLESNRDNQEYWRTMQIVCNDWLEKYRASGPDSRAVNSVSMDVDRLLGPKTHEQLETLEKQIRAKLRSDSDIDVDYWEQLLKSLLVRKAQAKIKKIYKAVLDAHHAKIRAEQHEKALGWQQTMRTDLSAEGVVNNGTPPADEGSSSRQVPTFRRFWLHEPEALTRLNNEDKSLEIVDEMAFLQSINETREAISEFGFLPSRSAPNLRAGQVGISKVLPKTLHKTQAESLRFAPTSSEDASKATNALYEKEAARGIDEDEEIFAAEETLPTTLNTQWTENCRPRKPRYFNRVQMGYEWNKYNQTHYDHDNPPPKVVQGYKFNIFYPDLIDKSKAPTYRITREDGRRRGESFAPAGEEDTCLLRFVAGPPYTDIAFRIVDKEWDYSAKRDRGYRSSFDKGILSLHFQFKKIYYRK